jgi:predicted NBD/HSP70 family sugar kinase
MGINMLDMKQSNTQTVLWSLCSCKTSTIKNLARLTELSFVTVGNILNGFVDSGEVILGKIYSGTGGRPSQAYTFNAEFAHVLVLSARVQNGKNVISACVGNLYGESVWKSEKHFGTIQLISFELMINKALREFPTISIVAFSLPGVERDGVILINDFAELEGISFAEHFQSRYQLPVIIENDVNAAALGYGRNVEGDSSIVGIYFPRFFCPGAGVVIDGKILKGASGYAGEVKLLPLGIDWISMNYDKPEEIGVAISKLISIFCGTINPDYVVLYGDFITESLKEAIEHAIPTEILRNIFPNVIYESNLVSDIIAGLIAQAVSAYQSGLCGREAGNNAN